MEDRQNKVFFYVTTITCCWLVFFYRRKVIADAIFDQRIHQANSIRLRGESIRRKRK